MRHRRTQTREEKCECHRKEKRMTKRSLTQKDWEERKTKGRSTKNESEEFEEKSWRNSKKVVHLLLSSSCVRRSNCRQLEQRRMFCICVISCVRWEVLVWTQKSRVLISFFFSGVYYTAVGRSVFGLGRSRKWSPLLFVAVAALATPFRLYQQ